jgi:phosphotransferase system HPr-like phosphotransfer protein
MVEGPDENDAFNAIRQAFDNGFGENSIQA